MKPLRCSELFWPKIIILHEGNYWNVQLFKCCGRGGGTIESEAEYSGDEANKRNPKGDKGVITS